MMYLTMIMTDVDEANDITPRIDHKAFPVKHVMKRPKLSLWETYKIKKLLELGYEKLNESKTDEVIEGEIQSNAQNI